MILGITCLVISFIYLGLTSFIYFIKKRIKNVENKIYKYMIISGFVNIINELGCIYTVSHPEIPLVITTIVNRLFIINLGLWVLLFTYYILIISFGEKKWIKYLFYLIFIITTIMYIILPIEFYYDGVKTYSYGATIDFEAIVIAIQLICWIFIVCAKRKVLKIKKVIPIIFFILAVLLNLFISQEFRGINILVASEVFITIMMYFTIENPDVKMIEQLNIARDQADRANSAKTEFLSSMSHEIRTPLNAVVGFAQALSEENIPEEAQDEVKDIMMASETLLDIVNGILDISKIEANKLEIVNTEYNFKNVLDELVALSKARIGEKPLEFRYNFSPDIPKYLFGDKLRVKQVMLNLLTNAIKYTHEGWIEFKIVCVNKDDICRLIISVQDTGIGIKQESIDKLFTRFERLDVEKNNTIEGTGLGLAITKKLIGLMGGQIVVQSVYGEGSKFTIAIDQKIVTNPTIETTQEVDTNLTKTMNLTNKRILIVDDNKVNLKVAERLLRDYHCIIDTLDSGFSCIDKISAGAQYDLILMDDMMPRMGGIETLHKLKEKEDFKTPVIALTANAISGMREKYLNEGFDDYLSKPIDKIELGRVLHKFLDK